MGVRQTLNIPPAAKFVLSDGIGIHIAGMFGDTWCSDTHDKDTGEYAPKITGELFVTEEPSTVDNLCQWCLKAAQKEEPSTVDDLSSGVLKRHKKKSKW